MQASLWKRLLAWQLDAFLFYGILNGLIGLMPDESFKVFSKFGIGTFAGPIITLSMMGAIFFFFLGGFIFYRAIMEASSLRGSLGYWCFGLQVSNDSGAQVGLPKALQRNFFLSLSSFIFFLDYAGAAYKGSRIGWSDRITKTLVAEIPDISERRQYRGLLLVWIWPFSWLTLRMNDAKEYISVLIGRENFLSPEQIQNFSKLAMMADFFVQIFFYGAAIIAVSCLILLLKTFFSHWKSAIDTWIIKQREAYLAIIPFAVPLIIHLFVIEIVRILLAAQIGLKNYFF